MAIATSPFSDETGFRPPHYGAHVGEIAASTPTRASHGRVQEAGLDPRFLRRARPGRSCGTQLALVMQGCIDRAELRRLQTGIADRRE
jgi:hypothetical protein